MTAKKQALLGICGGALLAAFVVLMGVTKQHQSGELLVVAIPMGMFYGFGYAFSGPTLKKWLAWAAGASGTVAFWALFSQIFFRRGLLVGLFLCIFLISGAIGLAYLPGLVIGVRRLWAESRA